MTDQNEIKKQEEDVEVLENVEDQELDSELHEMIESQGVTETECLEALQQGLAKRGQVSQQITLKRQDGVSDAQAIASFAIQPEVTSGLTVQRIIGNKFCGTNVEIDGLIEELNQQTELIKQKDLSRAEAMLASQAHTLDQIFNQLTMRAASNMGEYTSAAETYFKLAMKAQSQCRNTWEAVYAIQNPPLANYAKQLNVAGNQQVNNGAMQHAEEKEIPPNQQAEENNELLQD